MTKETVTVNAGKKQRVRISNAADSLKEIHAAIARRAYELYESRGAFPGRGGDDWRLAESEVVRPLCCGILRSGDSMLITTSLAGLDASEIELRVEPRRLIIVGKKRSSPRPGKNGISFRVLPLSDEVDPASVVVRQNGCVLEVELHKPASGEKPSHIASAA